MITKRKCYCKIIKKGHGITKPLNSSFPIDNLDTHKVNYNTYSYLFGILYHDVTSTKFIASALTDTPEPPAPYTLTKDIGRLIYCATHFHT